MNILKDIFIKKKHILGNKVIENKENINTNENDPLDTTEVIHRTLDCLPRLGNSFDWFNCYDLKKGERPWHCHSLICQNSICMQWDIFVITYLKNTEAKVGLFINQTKILLTHEISPDKTIGIFNMNFYSSLYSSSTIV